MIPLETKRHLELCDLRGVYRGQHRAQLHQETHRGLQIEALVRNLGGLDVEVDPEGSRDGGLDVDLVNNGEREVRGRLKVALTFEETKVFEVGFELGWVGF